jgi:DNA polymerase III epsilon subunit-like protein
MREEDIFYVEQSSRAVRRDLKIKAASRKLGANLGSVSGKAPKKMVPFDPNAEDGDGDLKVQDGSVWERPAKPSVPGAQNTTGTTDADIQETSNSPKEVGQALNSAAIEREKEYRGQHGAPDRDSGAPLHDMMYQGGIYPEDVYSSDAVRFYGVGDDRLDAIAAGLINSYRGRPNAVVSIYRAVPNSRAKRIANLEKEAAYVMRYGKPPRSANTNLSTSDFYQKVLDELEELRNLPEEERIKINPGDWVSPIRQYVIDHGNSHLGGRGKYQIVSKRVKAKDVYTAGDSWLEWGYDPDDSKSGGLSSGASLVENAINDDADDERLQLAEAIDNALEQQVGLFMPGLLLFEPDSDSFQSLREIISVKAPTSTGALSEAVKKYNEKYGTNHDLASMLSELIDNPSVMNATEGQKEALIKKFFPSRKTREDLSLKEHQSTDYRYGDKNKLGGEVRATSPDWLRGMTPEQIANVVIPEDEEALHQMLADEAGYLVDGEIIDSDGKEMTGREFANQQVVNSIPLDESSKNREILREGIKNALIKSPAFLQAVQKFGFPPIYVSDSGKINIPGRNTDRWIGAFNPSVPHIAITTFGIDEVITRGGKSISGPVEELGIGDFFNNSYDLTQLHLESQIMHEWGHYLLFLFDVLDTEFATPRRKKIRSVVGDEATKQNMEIAKKYSAANPEAQNILDQWDPPDEFYEGDGIDEVSKEWMDSQSFPFAISRYSHSLISELGAEGVAFALHPNKEIRTDGINQTLRNDIEALLGFSIEEAFNKTDETPIGAGRARRRAANSEQRLEMAKPDERQPMFAPELLEELTRQQGAADKPSLSSGGKAPRYPREPTLGAFLGAAEERFASARSWDEFREIYNDTEMVFLDYETTGLNFDEYGQATSNGNPTQIGLVRIKNGQEIGRLNLFMNPEEPLGDWSAKYLKDASGNPLTNEWLATQMSMEEAHKQVAEFIGPDAIIGVQNATFDKNVLEDTLAKHGIDWRPSGYLDTRDISAMTLPVWSEENPDGPYTIDKDGNKKPSSSLAAITEYLDVPLGEGHHNADADALATSQVMQKIIDRAIENDWSVDALSKEKRDEKLRLEREKFESDVVRFEKEKSDFLRGGLSSGASPSSGVNWDSLFGDGSLDGTGLPDLREELEDYLSQDAKESREDWVGGVSFYKTVWPSKYLDEITDPDDDQHYQVLQTRLREAGFPDIVTIRRRGTPDPRGEIRNGSAFENWSGGDPDATHYGQDTKLFVSQVPIQNIIGVGSLEEGEFFYLDEGVETVEIVEDKSAPDLEKLSNKGIFGGEGFQRAQISWLRNLIPELKEIRETDDTEAWFYESAQLIKQGLSRRLADSISNVLPETIRKVLISTTREPSAIVSSPKRLRNSYFPDSGRKMTDNFQKVMNTPMGVYQFYRALVSRIDSDYGGREAVEERIRKAKNLSEDEKNFMRAMYSDPGVDASNYNRENYNFADMVMANEDGQDIDDATSSAAQATGEKFLSHYREFLEKNPDNIDSVMDSREEIIANVEANNPGLLIEYGYVPIHNSDPSGRMGGAWYLADSSAPENSDSARLIAKAIPLSEVKSRRPATQEVSIFNYAPDSQIGQVSNEFILFKPEEMNEPSILDRELLVSSVIGEWAVSSGSPLSLKISSLVQEIFGTGGSFTSRDYINELSPEEKEVYSLIIKEMYDATQQMFADTGIKKLIVWRGASTTDEDFKKILIDKAESKDWSQPIIPEKVDTRPISSWSTSLWIAHTFSNGLAATEGYLTARMLDVEDILATALTGFGSSIEQEIIQLAPPVGKKQPITVLVPSWSATERVRKGTVGSAKNDTDLNEIDIYLENRDQYLLTIKNNLTNYIITS